jgi:protein-S-isoprenylcysteine O-methyltransferase Ste14
LPVFASGLGLILFDFAIFVWVASEIFGAALVPQLRQRGSTRVKRDRGSRALITFSILISVLIAFYFGYGGVGALPDWIFYLGVFLMFLGVLVRQYAIAILGRFFSLSVQIAEDHKVVDKGPYRLVRHPSYTGILITFAGLGLAVQSLGALLVLLLFFGISFGYRMYVEERTLLSALGQDYASYMKKTKRLIPFLI